MKKRGILNKELNTVISEMGHKDTITISDAGLPIPKNVKRIDLALKRGYPEFLKILKAVLEDLVVEKAFIASEIKEISPEMHKNLISLLGEIEVEYISHNQFKKQSEDSRAVVRSGETTPYANVILVSGVDF